jgi:hypothetical protein
VFSRYTFPLPSDGEVAIATCTALENACCLHAFEDAKMEKGQGEMRIMAQVGCRCPLDKQDAFLEAVRGFGARAVPAEWRQQLMVVRAEGLAGGSSGGGMGRKGKGKGKMPAAADDGVSSSDEDAAWELEDKEQLERARQASFHAAGSTGSSGGSGSGSASSSGGGISSTARPRSSRSSCTPINYSNDIRSVEYSSTR